MGIGIVKKLSYLLDRRQKISLFFLLIIIFGGSLMEMIGVSSVLPLINIIMTPDIISTDSKYQYVGTLFRVTDVKSFVIIMALGLLAVYLIKNIYLSIMYKLQYRYIYNNQRRMSVRMLRNYMSQEYLFFVSHNTAELQRNVHGDVTGMFLLLTNLMALTTEISTCIVLLVFLFIQDFQTTFALVLLMICFLMFMIFSYKKYVASLGEKNRIVSADINKYIIQAFSGIKEIKAANKESFFVSLYERTYGKHTSLQKKQQFTNIAPRLIMETLCICGLMGFISIRVYMGVPIQDFIPTLSVFAVALIRMLPAFTRITNDITMIMYTKPQLDAVYHDAREMEHNERNVETDKDDCTEINLQSGIDFSHVSFSYPTRPDKVVLKDISFNIPQKASFALVGQSGAGKSTIADLLLGILKPDSGHIMAGETDIVEHLASWRKLIGYIPQEIYLFDGSVRSNIALGVHDNEIDDTAVWDALKRAQLDDFISSQPNKLDTQIGERGAKLSGGQKQRLGIARALYRKPSILILDESTSALDSETETAVMESINNLAGSVTLIIIAHRLTTIKNCNIILEVKEGTVKQKDYEDLNLRGIK